MIAVFYDVENLVEHKYYELAIEKVKEIAIKERPLQFAYAEWGRFTNSSKNLFINNGIGMKQVINGVGYHSTIKNASDIAIVVDAMEMVCRNKQIEHFILVSGDGGFISLVLKLKEYGIKVSIVSLSENANKSIIEYADEHFLIANKEDIIVEANELDNQIQETIQAPATLEIQGQVATNDFKYEHYQKIIWAIMCNSESAEEAVSNLFKHREIKSQIKEHGISTSYLKATYYKTQYSNPQQKEFSKEFSLKLNKKIKSSYSKVSGLIVPKVELLKVKKEDLLLSSKDIRKICKEYGLSFSMSNISDSLFLEVIQNKSKYMILNQEDMTALLIKNTKRRSLYADTVVRAVFMLAEDKRLALSSINYQTLLSGAISLYINSASKNKMPLTKKHIADMMKWNIS